MFDATSTATTLYGNCVCTSTVCSCPFFGNWGYSNTTVASTWDWADQLSSGPDEFWWVAFQTQFARSLREFRNAFARTARRLTLMVSRTQARRRKRRAWLATLRGAF